MTLLYLGMLLFGGIHLYSLLLPGNQNTAIDALGQGRFKMIYSILALAGLILMIWGFAGSRSGPASADQLYYLGDWPRHAAMLLVLLAFIALGASHGKGYLKLWLKQPMSIGIALWSGAHLLANGKRAAVYLFGTFFVIAILDIVLSTIRGKVPAHEPRIRSDMIAVIAGVALYAVFLFGFHPYVLNLPVVQ
jgi:uncharacterized membrane protein